MKIFKNKRKNIIKSEYKKNIKKKKIEEKIYEILKDFEEELYNFILVLENEDGNVKYVNIDNLSNDEKIKIKKIYQINNF